MNYFLTQQATQLDSKFPHIDAWTIDSILYFTVKLENCSKQLWKTDGTTTVFVTNI